MPEPGPNSLVLYKNLPARVVHAGDKLEIELPSGKTRKVRPKDVALLHQGPIACLSELKHLAGEVDIAWDILAGETTTLHELAELIYDRVTPASVWATWQEVAEGLYFFGTPESIQVRSADDLEKERTAREAKNADEMAWTEFISRVRDGKVLPAERENLSGVEALAYGRTAQSRVLRELGRGMTPENAHALLLKLGHWTYAVNPYPLRFGLSTDTPTLEIPALPEEERFDFTHLPAFAIDDEGNTDPDDAISLDGDRFWVHVADVAALVRPKSGLDQEALNRAANLYLPETTVAMLPTGATELLGLGLHELSPALSIGFHLSDTGELEDIQIVISTVRVTRLSYEDAEGILDKPFFNQWDAAAERFKERRGRDGSISIALPEVKIRVVGDEVQIQPLPKLRSREIVTEAMLMAGEAAARFAQERSLPFPYTTQAPPDAKQCPTDLASMFAFRKHFKRSRIKTTAEPHAGLGLAFYARTTSPLRRYLDLVVHQQLRAWIKGEDPLSSQEVSERIDRVDAIIDGIRRAERFSNKHWALVYLKKNPDWQGVGMLVEHRGKRGTVLIPELGLESSIHLETAPPLNSEISLSVAKVNLPELSVRLNVISVC